MAKPKIAFMEYDAPREQVFTRLEPLASEIMFRSGTLNEHLEEVSDCEIVSVFIHSRLDEKLLARMPNLRLIVTRSTGYDHIDLQAAEARGITISNIPYYGENTVAEHTFALILSLSRNIHKAHVRTAKTVFSLEGLEGFDLKDKTLGVIGVGHIGLRVIKIAKGFGMNVLAFDVRRDHFIAEVLGFDYAELDTVLAESHVITLHAPYNQHTHHLINKDNIKKIRPGALLINTARGGLIETDALVWALDTGLLGGAGLDVLEGEELISDEMQALSSASKQSLVTLIKTHIMLNRENVVITPHIAFYSKEAQSRIVETTVQNIVSFLEGRSENVITLPGDRKAA